MADPAVLFYVDGVDFSDCVSITGFRWKTNDIDAESSGRPRSTTMRRRRLGTKRALTVKGRDKLPYARAHALAVALDKTFVSIRYLDLRNGVCTKTFYGTSIDTSAMWSENGKTYVNGISFELVEK